MCEHMHLCVHVCILCICVCCVYMCVCTCVAVDDIYDHFSAAMILCY